jgi:hypothetical protein
LRAGQIDVEDKSGVPANGRSKIIRKFKEPANSGFKINDNVEENSDIRGTGYSFQELDYFNVSLPHQ